MSVDIQLGSDVLLEVTCVDDSGASVDVSTATEKTIYLKPPTGSRVDKTASFTTDGTDGKIEYQCTGGELNQLSLWQIQGKAVIDGHPYYSEIDTFNIKGNL